MRRGRQAGGPADFGNNALDGFAQQRHRVRDEPVARTLLGGAAAVDRVKLAARAEEGAGDGVEAFVPFADRHAVALLGGFGERRVETAADETPVVAGGGLQGGGEFGALGRFERDEVGAAHGGAAHVDTRADFEPRDEHGRARADGVDHDHVEAVAHRQMDRQRRAFGEAGEEGPGAGAQVGIAQEAVGEFEDRRGEHEALAVGQARQETGGDERAGQTRERRLRDAGELGQFAIAERRVGGGDGAQDGEAARERGNFFGAAVSVAGRVGRSAVIGGGGHERGIFRNAISILFARDASFNA
ncbi:hypothetical protein PT2222_240040 [Paraburkholderia tropica]